MKKTAAILTIPSLFAALAMPARAQGVEDSSPLVERTNAKHGPSDGEITFEGGRAFRGQAQRPLTGADFYLAVDRPDLAERYRLREERRSVGVAVGLLVMGAGVVWGLADAWDTAWDNFTCCGAPPGPTRTVSPYPWLVAGAGLAGFVIAHRTEADPVSESERLELARAHNRKSISIVPQLQPGGGGLAMMGRF
jgi:hypothetical protein